MTLLIPSAVEKQMETMPQADAQRLLARLTAIADAPAQQHANVMALSGRPGVYRVRQGDWRAVFRIEASDVVAIRVAHRREVYK